MRYDIYGYLTKNFTSYSRSSLFQQLLASTISCDLEYDVESIENNRINFNIADEDGYLFAESIIEGDTSSVFFTGKPKRLSDSNFSCENLSFNGKCSNSSDEKVKYSSLEVVRGDDTTLFTAVTANFQMNEQDAFHIESINFANYFFANEIIDEKYSETLTNLTKNVGTKTIFDYYEALAKEKKLLQKEKYILPECYVLGMGKKTNDSSIMITIDNDGDTFEINNQYKLPCEIKGFKGFLRKFANETVNNGAICIFEDFTKLTESDVNFNVFECHEFTGNKTEVKEGKVVIKGKGRKKVLQWKKV